MKLSAALFDAGFLWILALVVGVLIVAAFWCAPWKALIEKAERQHAFFAAWLSLVVMMHLQISWVDGLVSIHFLMMTSIVVIFGWSFSMIIGLLAHVLLSVWHQDYSIVVAANYFLSVIIPASTAYTIYRIIIQHQSKNLFVFLLGGGFFGAIATLLFSLAALFILLMLNQQWDILEELYHKSLMVVLLSYSEGFLNGMVVTALTVFFPGIVRTFDEKKYLDS
ncbi:MAG: hypothetical protein CSA49_04235 [Gammaproteobacteria bacterium]|nr:MAG: hypothetical protein CSA49_04235 [Gammaproteobacteria bacterium]